MNVLVNLFLLSSHYYFDLLRVYLMVDFSQTIVNAEIDIIQEFIS